MDVDKLFEFEINLMLCVLPAAHMPIAAWIGLNDIHVENQFVFSDGTSPVSDEAVNVIPV